MSDDPNAFATEYLRGFRDGEAALTAERDRLREERDEARAAWIEARDAGVIWLTERSEAWAERDTLAAQLARAAPVIEAAVAWRATWDCDAEPGSADPVDLMIAAVDAYQATPATTEREGAGDGDLA